MSMIGTDSRSDQPVSAWRSAVGSLVRARGREWVVLPETKGDLVVVISGRDKGRQGRVLEVLVESQRLVVEGVQRVQKHVKAGQTQRGTRTGGIETVEAPIHISNVMLVDPETKKGTRVGYRTEEIERNGRTRAVRVRVAKRSGKDI